METLPTIALSSFTDYGSQDTQIEVCGARLSVRLRPEPRPGPHIAAMKRVQAAIERLKAPAAEEPGTEGETQTRMLLDFFEGREASDERRHTVEMIVAWLVSWNATDAEGNPLPMTVEALYEDATRTDVYKIILGAIEAKAAELANPPEAGELPKTAEAATADRPPVEKPKRTPRGGRKPAEAVA